MTIEDTAAAPGGQVPNWRKWLGLHSRTYMTEHSVDSLRYRRGFLEVHDHRIRRLDVREVPAGWEPTPRPKFSSGPSAEPIFAATRWRRFDLDRRVVVADVPISTSCFGPTLGTQRATLHCHRMVNEIDLNDGSRTRLLDASERRNWHRIESGGYSGPWVLGKRMFIAFHHQLDRGSETPAAIVEMVERAGGQPGREEIAATFPSATIKHAMPVRERLLFISMAESSAWMFDPVTRSFERSAVALPPDATDIIAISYTADYLLLALEMPAKGGRRVSRILVLDDKFRVVHSMDVDGEVTAFSSTERPWPSTQAHEGMRLVNRR